MIYFIEIRNRFIITFFAFVSTLLICYTYKEIILLLIMDLSTLDELEFNSFNFIFTGVTELFHVYLKLVFLTSFQSVLLFGSCQVLLFISPALYKTEFLIAKSYLSSLFISFSITLLIVLNYIFPVSWQFFYSFQSDNTYSNSFSFESRVVEFVDFFIAIYFYSMIYFQVFIFLVFFFKDYLRNKLITKKFRKLIFLIFATISTLVSPPDIYSQLFILFFLFITYESILLLNLFKLVR